MKKMFLFKALLMAAIAVMGIACQDDDAAAPTGQSIKIEAGKSSILVGESTTLVVTVFPEDAADRNNYTLTVDEAGEAVISLKDNVATALSEGTATIIATLGELTATCEITVTAPAPELSKDTADATYAGECWDNPDAATYYINFQSEGFEMDDFGDITSDADSYTLCVTFTADFSADSDHAVLPDGTYTGDDNYATGTFLTNVEEESYLIHVVDGETVWEALTAGSVTVKSENGIYDIACDLTLASGETFTYSYRGEILFHNRSGEGVGSTLTGNVDIPQLTDAYIVMLGESMFETEESVNAYMVLGDDNFDTETLLGTGHGLTIYFNIPLDAETIPDGTYNMGEDATVGTLVPGMMYYGMFFGCWYFQGQHEAALLGGTVTFATSGEESTVTIALEDGNGNVVSASYQGVIPVYGY